MHRGAAFGDFDGDGRIDIVVTRLNERAELLHNRTPGGNHWLGLRLVGTRSNRDGIGARIRIGNKTNHVTTSVGFACSSDKVVHFGLGAAATAALVEIEWPSGAKQRLTDVAADRVVSVTEPSSR
jgi:hypothetical protein